MKKHMTPEEMRTTIAELYERGGQSRLAADIDRDKVTVCHWCTGKTSIGGSEALLVRLLLVLHRRRVNWRKWINELKMGDVI